MVKPFKAPQVTIRMGGSDYIFRAGLREFMRFTEAASDDGIRERMGQPRRFTAVPPPPDAPDAAPGMRLLMNEDNAALYFHSFCAAFQNEGGGFDSSSSLSLSDWELIIQTCRPSEVLRAWHELTDLLDTAELDWSPEEGDEAPFRA